MDKSIKKDCKPCHLVFLLFIILIVLFIIKFIIIKCEKYQNANKQALIDKFYKYAAKYRINQNKMEHNKHRFEESYEDYLKSKKQLDYVMNELT